MVRIVCAVFVAGFMTTMAMAPAAAAASCYVEWDGRTDSVVCGETDSGMATASWTWAFSAAWASIVALLLMSERCARRREVPERREDAICPFPGIAGPSLATAGARGAAGSGTGAGDTADPS